MTIEYDIIESVYQTLINNADLQKFINPKKDIYKGVPSNEQAVSKNYIVIEAEDRQNIKTLYNGNEAIAYIFGLNVVLTVVYTEENKQQGLEKFLEFTAIIENAIATSSHITAKTAHIETIRDYFKEKLFQRAAEIKYQFSGSYNAGNL